VCFFRLGRTWGFLPIPEETINPAKTFSIRSPYKSEWLPAGITASPQNGGMDIFAVSGFFIVFLFLQSGQANAKND
jgi:hypothetical protein